MKIKIHRGTGEIGGTCIEVFTETTHILLDFGMPLVNPDQTPFDSRSIRGLDAKTLIERGVLPDVPAVHGPSDTHLILSHAHKDHYGLLPWFHESCTTWLSPASMELIELTGIFTMDRCRVPNPRYFEPGVPFCIGDMEITPWPMDHSAFDSYGFLIRSGGKRLFYTGDFRKHGRKPETFRFLEEKGPKNVDCLLMEGTAIGWEGEFDTEKMIEDAFAAEFSDSPGPHLVYTSCQNTDRLVSIFNACRRAGKTLAIDFYPASVLKRLSRFSNLPVPSEANPEIKVFFPYGLCRMMTDQGLEREFMYPFAPFKIKREEMDEMAENLVMLVRPSFHKMLESFENLSGGTFIYSMWDGYKEDEKYQGFIQMLREKGMHEKDLHTCGHADRQALSDMVNLLNPASIIPIHTFEADTFVRVFEGRRVLRAVDGVAFSI
ncbi:ribonuclease J [Desulfobotulus alkaliphilus]|uniref:Ribonuclease J n=1 Tax=Desulfobotulus alkaliphilus TaxID=622671 RepID=A0A562R276_9BACT|nr:MBL fold metallo-hydrolase [Desulfobotulus alkaliphilus]TWI63141.1 ribonuclease J [Desulfobotulus alkaliphilus]